MSHNWLQVFRKQLGIPGLHISTDAADSCQHRVRRFPGTRIDGNSAAPKIRRCWYCSPLYRGRHRARTAR